MALVMGWKDLSCGTPASLYLISTVVANPSLSCQHTKHMYAPESYTHTQEAIAPDLQGLSIVLRMMLLHGQVRRNDAQLQAQHNTGSSRGFIRAQ